MEIRRTGAERTLSWLCREEGSRAEGTRLQHKAADQVQNQGTAGDMGLSHTLCNC